jgi:hypothetical protein
MLLSRLSVILVERWPPTWSAASSRLGISDRRGAYPPSRRTVTLEEFVHLTRSLAEGEVEMIP